MCASARTSARAPCASPGSFAPSRRADVVIGTDKDDLAARVKEVAGAPRAAVHPAPL